jgi:pyruvate/2-oxoglutarate dehydrogenase complex dihydrolipoamide dehydrogenase (E3) component
MLRACTTAEKIMIAIASKPRSRVEDSCCGKAACNEKKPVNQHVIPNTTTVLSGDLSGMEGAPFFVRLGIAISALFLKSLIGLFGQI